MLGYLTSFGIDSHALTTTVCAIVAGTGEVATRRLDGNGYGEIRDWMLSFPQPSMGVYESGCTGFVPARLLSCGGVEVFPIAASAIPTSPEPRPGKTDARDAERLARLALGGDFKRVWVPPAEAGGLRDLSQAIRDAAARQRLQAFLLKRGEVWRERTPRGAPRKKWGAAHRRWLETREMPDAASRLAYESALAADREAGRAYDELVESARAAAAASCLGPVVDAVQHVKGCGFVAALAFAAEVGDFSRFSSGRKVAAYFGLVPSERSSANRRRLGGVTKGGCQMVRRLLTECAWTYARARAACDKRGPVGVPAEVAAHARRCSRHIAGRRASMLERGVQANKANAATAAEMARMMWAVGLMAQAAAAA